MVYGIRSGASKWRMMLIGVVILTALTLAGCEKQTTGGNLTFTTEYQAVFMENGQVFFGKLQNAGSPYPLLKSVFYIRQQVNPETKELRQVLLRRANELHKPDQMYINAGHIAIIEPVAADSQVARLIKEAEAQKPAAGQYTNHKNFLGGGYEKKRGCREKFLGFRLFGAAAGSAVMGGSDYGFVDRWKWQLEW